MKRRIWLVAFALVLSGSGFHCKKSNAANIWMGKLVVAGTCGDFIVQLQSGPVPDSSILTKSWTDSLTDSSFTNVFKVSDVCTFGLADVQVGDVFTFTLNAPPPVQTCFICDIVPSFPMPATSNVVTNIKILTIH